MSGEPTDDREAQSSELLTVHDFENLKLPEILQKYEGEGATSYAAKGDIDKKNYLESLRIFIPEWTSSDNESILPEARALFVTAFIVTCNIVTLEQIRRDNVAEQGFDEAFKLAIDGRNAQIKESRLDNNGWRQRLPNGKFVEDYYRDLGFSSNPEKRVSEDELQKIVKYIFSQLHGKKVSWLDFA